jgi:hypothetical protein
MGTCYSSSPTYYEREHLEVDLSLVPVVFEASIVGGRGGLTPSKREVFS